MIDPSQKRALEEMGFRVVEDPDGITYAYKPFKIPNDENHDINFSKGKIVSLKDFKRLSKDEG